MCGQPTSRLRSSPRRRAERSSQKPGIHRSWRPPSFSTQPWGFAQHPQQGGTRFGRFGLRRA
eukprot:7323310-Alexandrium_andersonii.AAC.1